MSDIITTLTKIANGEADYAALEVAEWTPAALIEAAQDAAKVERFAAMTQDTARAAQVVAAYALTDVADMAPREAIAAITGRKVSAAAATEWGTLGRAIVRHGVSVAGGDFAIVRRAYGIGGNGLTALTKTEDADIVAHAETVIGRAATLEIRADYGDAEALPTGEPVQTTDAKRGAKRSPLEIVLALLADADDRTARLDSGDRDAVAAALAAMAAKHVTVPDTIAAIV